MSADPKVPPATPPAGRPNLVPEGSGQPKNVAAAYAIMFLGVGGVIYYTLDRKEPFVRFYCVQSIGLGAVGLTLWIVFSLIAKVFVAEEWYYPLNYVAYLYRLLWLGLLVVAGVAALHAYRGRRWEIPILWPLARRFY